MIFCVNRLEIVKRIIISVVMRMRRRSLMTRSVSFEISKRCEMGL